MSGETEILRSEFSRSSLSGRKIFDPPYWRRDYGTALHAGELTTCGSEFTRVNVSIYSAP